MQRSAVLALLLVCGCNQGKEDDGAGAVTADEARALEDAAEMLAERRLSPDDLRKVPAVDTTRAQSNDAQGAEQDAGR